MWDVKDAVRSLGQHKRTLARSPIGSRWENVNSCKLFSSAPRAVTRAMLKQLRRGLPQLQNHRVFYLILHAEKRTAHSSKGIWL